MTVRSTRKPTWLTEINGRHHTAWLTVFMVIVLAHWVEHVVQAVQIYVWGMPRPVSLGLIGQVWPWLFRSEWLHYGFALVMLVFLIVLRPGFTGRSRQWWDLALGLQVWHHLEHLLLLLQAQTGRNFFGAATPTSVLQLLVPRVELHLFYNAVVFAPMVVAVVLHRRGDPVAPADCRCARRSPAPVAS